MRFEPARAAGGAAAGTMIVAARLRKVSDAIT
jgi:hypothetical protein